MRRTAELSILAVLVALLVPLAASCGVRGGDVVLLPVNFEGWVVIHYEDPSGTPLETEGARTLIRVPPSGVVRTSSPRAEGYGLDKYYFVASNGSRVRVQHEAEGCEDQGACVQQFEFISSPTKTTVFFVGEKGNLGRYRRPEL